MRRRAAPWLGSAPGAAAWLSAAAPSAAQIILDGGTVDYDGPSGSITLDEFGDPTEATVGIYRYNADNTYSRTN